MRSVGQKQRVEIIKALYRGAAILILDEPTAVITPQEVSELLITLRQMVKDGHALIFISHKLHEVLDISDRITVLRDGRVIGTLASAQTTQGELARMMVGREMGSKPERIQMEQGQVSLALSNLSANSDRETPALRGVNLEVRNGKSWGWLGFLAMASANWRRQLLACARSPMGPASGTRPALRAPSPGCGLSVHLLDADKKV